MLKNEIVYFFERPFQTAVVVEIHQIQNKITHCDEVQMMKNVAEWIVECIGV